MGPARVACAHRLPLRGGERRPYEDLVTDFDYEPGDRCVLDARLCGDGAIRRISRTVAAAAGGELTALGHERVACGELLRYPQ